MTDVETLDGDHIKVGDTEPDLRVQVFNSVGNPFNLDGYTVDIRLRRSDADTNTVDGEATPEIANKGIVTYSWQSGDTDTSGTYIGEIIADDGAGSVVTFPNEGFFHVYIEEGL